MQAWIRKSKLFIEWIWNRRLTLFVAFKRHIYISVLKTYNLKEITVTRFQLHEIGSELDADINLEVWEKYTKWCIKPKIEYQMLQSYAYLGNGKYYLTIFQDLSLNLSWPRSKILIQFNTP